MGMSYLKNAIIGIIILFVVFVLTNSLARNMPAPATIPFLSVILTLLLLDYLWFGEVINNSETAIKVLGYISIGLLILTVLLNFIWGIIMGALSFIIFSLSTSSVPSKPAPENRYSTNAEEINKSFKGLHIACLKCGHVWKIKKDFGFPARCPVCNSIKIRLSKLNFEE
jgi:hypothetical protein